MHAPTTTTTAATYTATIRALRAAYKAARRAQKRQTVYQRFEGGELGDYIYAIRNSYYSLHAAHQSYQQSVN